MRKIVPIRELAVEDKEMAGISDNRASFLMQMHSEMWKNINRHLTVSWQAIGVLAGSFVLLFSLSDKPGAVPDFGAAIVLVIGAWQLGHVYDANTWFNRNLGIIANIERQFLTNTDAHDIHFYFTEKHRSAGDLVSHLAVQRDFGIVLMVLVVVAHFVLRVLPGIHQPISKFDAPRVLPYVIAAAALAWIQYQRSKQSKKQKEFNKRSPGKDVQGLKSEA